MSSQNAYTGPNGARPVGRPAGQEQRQRQPSWVQPQAQGAIPQQQPAPGYQGGFGQPGFAHQGQQQPTYAQWSGLQPSTQGHAAPPTGPDPHAPQFEPYVPPAYNQQPAAFGYAHQPQSQPQPHPQAQAQWHQRGADPRGFDAGAYMAPGHAAQPSPHPAQARGLAHDGGYYEPDLGYADWNSQPGGFGHDPQQHAQGGAELGFGQPEGGQLEAAYDEEDDEYETEDEPRSRRPFTIVAALLGAILVGGGMAYGYKKFSLAEPQGEPPLIKSEAFPSKTKPADAGGKQFPYSDSKLLGRLGDGSSAPGDASSGGAASADASDAASSAGASTDEGGARKVATLVVGRDGSIQAPSAAPMTVQPPPPQSAPSNDVSVPGTSLVDVFGASRSQGGDAASAPAESPAAPTKLKAGSAKKAAAAAPVTIAKVNGASSAKAATSSTGSIAERDDAAAPQPPVKKTKKVARAETTTSDVEADATAPPVVTSGGAGGYVAVLASIPRSASSRMDALKRFADMQEKYGSALAGKTPDVAEANLGSKGAYHRLIIGPPGSREQASTVCSQLKSQGYNDCWVTTY